MTASVYPPARIAAGESAQEQRDKRQSGRPGPGREGDPRSPSRRDRDRILYSSALQRLTNVTQVVTPDPGGALTHNRLTHSIKVAQVARSIAEILLSDEEKHSVLIDLGGLDADVAEAAALAHDLGHPPFGHIGEVVLDAFARDELGLPEGFEGNAQTFRIVARLEKRSSGDGMDLTAATRCAILKYPWQRIQRLSGENEHRAWMVKKRSYELQWEKFGYYAEEQREFEQARSIFGMLGENQSVEAAIMDLADDVTYALHDLQDFYLARDLPILTIRKELDEYAKQYADIDNPEDTPDGVTRTTFVELARKLKRNYPSRYRAASLLEAVVVVLDDITANFADQFDATPLASANVSRFVSNKIGVLTREIEVTADPSGERAAVYLRDEMWHQIQVLKHLTSEQVIGRPYMAIYQRGQQRTLIDLLSAMATWWEDKRDQRRLPQPLSEWRRDAEDKGRDTRRCLIDFVASLSDQQATGLRRDLSDGGRGLLRSLVL